MNIDKYKKDGDYIAPDGANQGGDPSDFMQSGMLGFCCCGNPDASLSLVRDVLRHISNLKEFVWSGKRTYEEWDAAGKAICDGRAMYFLYYFLDAKGWTEHGGSVPGWLTADGYEILEDLDTILSAG
jgi:hypothetical protein